MNRFQIWISSWIGLVAAVANIITLGFFIPSWEMDWCIYCAEKAVDDESE